MGNTTLQLAASPSMRGRIMGLWSVAFMGSTPIGGPIVGWVGQHLGSRYGLGLGGVAAILAAALLYPSLARIQRRAVAEQGSPVAPAREPAGAAMPAPTPAVVARPVSQALETSG
jgi:MFS family permease